MRRFVWCSRRPWVRAALIRTQRIQRLDPFCKTRVLNFLKRLGGLKSEKDFRIAVVPSTASDATAPSSSAALVSCTFPLFDDPGFGPVQAVGFAPTINLMLVGAACTLCPACN